MERTSISVIPSPEGVEKSWRETELRAADDAAFVYHLWRDLERLAVSYENFIMWHKNQVPPGLDPLLLSVGTKIQRCHV